MVEDYKYLKMHTDSRLNWVKNTVALEKVGQKSVFSAVLVQYLSENAQDVR